MSIINEITEERKRQDAKWGGPEHDDQHLEIDWEDYIEERLEGPRIHRKPYRQRMLEIAALAVAAIESYDRKAK